MADTSRQDAKRKREEKRNRRRARNAGGGPENPGGGGDGDGRSLWERLDTVGKRVAAIAALIAAITGAVAGVRQLLPEKTTPANVRAVLDPVELRVGVALDEFAAHETFITASVRGDGGGGRFAAAPPVRAAGALLLAQARTEPGDAGTPPASSAGAQTPTVPDGATTTGEDTPGEEGETTTGETTPGDDDVVDPATDDPVVPPREEALCAQKAVPPGEAPPSAAKPVTPPEDPQCGGLVKPADLRKRPIELVREREEVVEEIKGSYVLGKICAAQLTSSTCPFTSGLGTTPMMLARSGTLGEPGDPDEAPPPGTAREVESQKLAVARANLRQLRNTKFERGPDGRKRPLGIVVDYGARLCGFTDRRARVFWSMFDTGRPPRLPYLWVHHRLANVIRQRSTDCEEVAPRFWVPLPAVKGRFTLELTVVDEDGTTRSRRRTEPFAS